MQLREALAKVRRENHENQNAAADREGAATESLKSERDKALRELAECKEQVEILSRTAASYFNYCVN